MSPKKRRSHASRSKGPTPRRTTPEALAMREAQVLTDPAAVRLFGELFASEHLGATWPNAGMGQREPEWQVLAAMLAEARRRPSPTSAAALAACRLVLADPELEVAIKELGQPLPSWADEPAPQPRRAWRSGDPWRSNEVYFLEYDDHALMAMLRYPGGTRVEELTVVELDSLDRYDTLTAGEEQAGEREPAAIGDAVQELRDAMRWTELTWPREPSESYAKNRLLVRARLRALPDEPRDEPDRLPSEERERLRAAFLGNATGEVEQYAAELFLDYADGHLRNPLLWGPEDALLFLLDWVPRKVVMDEAERAALPELLIRWVVFVHERAGLEPRWQEPVVQVVREAATQFAELYDEQSDSVARQLAAHLAAPGLELADKEAVQAEVRAWNAEQLARRVLADSRGADESAEEGDTDGHLG